MRSGISAALTLADYRLSKTVVRPKMKTPEIVGFFVGGGTFQSELRSLNSEIQTTNQALANLSSRATNPGATPLTQAQQDWISVVWGNFSGSWAKFHNEYAFGWKSINFPIVTSRLEQVEDYRRKFIDLRVKAVELFSNETAVTSLPPPSPPKSWGALEEITSAIKGAVIWILVALAAFMVITRWI